jgi:hypothetical protein
MHCSRSPPDDLVGQIACGGFGSLCRRDTARLSSDFDMVPIFTNDVAISGR